MISAKNVSIEQVTSEQIGRCHKIFIGSIPAYMVESESDDTKEYRVTWDAKHGFRCTCPSGQVGFCNSKNGVCKHVVWSLAAAKEERDALAEMQAAMCIPVKPVTSVDAETLARVMVASQEPAKVSRAKAPTSKAFSLLR